MTQPAAPQTFPVRFLDGNVHLCPMGSDGQIEVPAIGAFNVIDILTGELGGDRAKAQEVMDAYIKSRGVAEKTPDEAATKATK